MGNIDNYITLLGVIGRDGATRSRLERIQSGWFKGRLEFYVTQKILYVVEASDKRDDMFYLTPLGIKLWQHEVSIQDIEGESIK